MLTTDLRCDVIVVGMQRAGLVAAAVLAKAGRDVLVVDNGENAVTYRHKGLQLPLCPTLIPALGHSPCVQQLVRTLGIGHALRTAMTGMRPAYQVILPNRRVDIPGSAAGLVHELGAEFPEYQAVVSSFVERLAAANEEITELLRQGTPMQPSGLKERLWATRVRHQRANLEREFEDSMFLEGVPEDHPLRQILLGPFPFFAHLANRRPTIFQAVRMLSCYFSGAVAFPDRTGGLSRLLLGLAEEAGVRTAPGAVVEELEMSGRRIIALRCAAGKRYAADYFIANTLSPFHELLPAGRNQARFTAAAQAVRPVASLVVQNLVVKREVIPMGMAEAVFLLNGRRQSREDHPEDPPLFVRRYPAQTGAPGTSRGLHSPPVDERYEVLSIAAPARLHDIQHSPERLAGLKALMFERVARLVPYLEEHVVDTSMPLETGDWDSEAGERRIDPLRAHQFFETEAPPAWGVAGLQPHTRIRNLVQTGCEVLPGLGVEGEYISGVRAAEVLCRSAGKRWQTTEP